MNRPPVAAAVRLWFFSNLLNSLGCFFYLLVKESMAAAYGLVLIPLIGLCLTSVLIPFIHWVNRLVLAMPYGYMNRFISLIVFQLALAGLFWVLFFLCFGMDEGDHFFTALAIISGMAVAITVATHYTYFLQFEPENETHEMV